MPKQAVRWIKILNRMKTMRKKAIAQNITWAQAMELIGGDCLLCREAKRLSASTNNMPCSYCLWLSFEGRACFDYRNHSKAVIRYDRWIEKLGGQKVLYHRRSKKLLQFLLTVAVVLVLTQLSI